MKDWKTHEVTVSFTLRAMDEEHAMNIMEIILTELEEYDQIPEWWVKDATEAMTPDEIYEGRIAEGETSPLDILN
jgi:hypothetical protein